MSKVLYNYSIKYEVDNEYVMSRLDRCIHRTNEILRSVERQYPDETINVVDVYEKISVFMRFLGFKKSNSSVDTIIELISQIPVTESLYSKLSFAYEYCVDKDMAEQQDVYPDMVAEVFTEILEIFEDLKKFLTDDEVSRDLILLNNAKLVELLNMYNVLNKILYTTAYKDFTGYTDIAKYIELVKTIYKIHSADNDIKHAKCIQLKMLYTSIMNLMGHVISDKVLLHSINKLYIPHMKELDVLVESTIYNVFNSNEIDLMHAKANPDGKYIR